MSAEGSKGRKGAESAKPKRASTKRPTAKGEKSTRQPGRPTDYRPEYAEQAKKLTLLGATDVELADFFQVAVSTISRWKVMQPEFSEALKVGKDAADERVAQSLYHRALGYSHPEVDIRVVEGQIVQTPLIKHYPPDTTAAIFWLKNRRKEEWRDKVDVDHGVQPDNPLIELFSQLAGKTLKPGAGE